MTPNPNDPLFYRVPPVAEPTKKSWLQSHMILGVVFLVVVLAAIVAGIYYWQTTREIPSFVQAPVHREPTENWKTYSNTEYGFEFKYPESWTKKNDDKKNILVWSGKENSAVTESDIFNVVIMPDSAHSTLKNLKDECEINCHDPRKEIKQGTSEIVFVDIPFCCTGDPGMYAMAYALNPEKKLELGFSIISSGEAEKSYKTYTASQVMDLIISTFKFTEVAAPSDWKTYSNAEYGFEFKYPETWERKNENKINEALWQGRPGELSSKIDIMSLKIIPNSKNTSLEHLKNIECEYGCNDTVREIKKDSLNIIVIEDPFCCSGDPGMITKITLLNKETKLEIQITIDSTGSDKLYKSYSAGQVADLLISTFKFTK